MQCNSNLLRSLPIFEGIPEAEFSEVLSFIGGNCMSFSCGDTILHPETDTAPICLILSGSVRIFWDDTEGERSIFSQLEKGDMFGNVISSSIDDPLLITAVAHTPCTVYSFSHKRLLGPCSLSCSLHTRLVNNFLKALLSENRRLRQKIVHLSCRTTRDKLVSYLSDQAQNAGSEEFFIPFNRQELADYLCVDRSAMSSELSKLQQEGILTFKKNRFMFLAGAKVKNHHPI